MNSASPNVIGKFDGGAQLLLSSRSSLADTNTATGGAAKSDTAKKRNNAAVQQSSGEADEIAAVSFGNSSPRRKPRALSGSPSRRTVNDADVVGRAQPAADYTTSGKQQYRVAFLDQKSSSPTHASPIRRQSSSAALTALSGSPRPEYFSQVTLQPQQPKVTWAADGHYRAADVQKETASNMKTMPLTSLSGDAAGFGSLRSAITYSGDDHPDAPTLTTLFAPLYHNGNSKVQLQRSISLYQAKLKKARRKLEEEQGEREKALNAYLRCAVNAVNADERARRKDEFQRRNNKFSTNISHLEKKIDEYKGKIDRFSNDLAASTSSSGTSGDSRNASSSAAAAVSTTTTDAVVNNNNNTNAASPSTLVSSTTNKWKSFTLPPGSALGLINPGKQLLSVKSVTGSSSTKKTIAVAPNAARGSAPVSQLHSASSINLDRMEQNHHAPTAKRDSTATVESLVAESVTSQPSSFVSFFSAQPANGGSSRPRDGKMALSLRDSASSTATTAQSGTLSGKSKDDSALSGGGGSGALMKKDRSNNKVVRPPGSSSGGDTSSAVGGVSGRTSGSTRWYHNNIGGNDHHNNSNNAEFNAAPATNSAAGGGGAAFSLLDDEQVSVSSLGTGSRTGASGGDSNEIFLRQKFDLLFHELNDMRARFDDCTASLDNIRQQNENQYAKLSQTIEEGVWKSQAIEQQLVDVVDLRRADVDSWRRTVEEMEERISYQIQERLRDMQENFDRLDTRFSLMEHTQAREKALLSLESIQNSTTQQMLFKSLNLLLAILQFVIVLGSSAAAMIAPIFESKMSFFAATLVVAVAVMVVNSVDTMSDLLNPLKFLKTWMDFMLHSSGDSSASKLSSVESKVP